MTRLTPLQHPLYRRVLEGYRLVGRMYSRCREG